MTYAMRQYDEALEKILRDGVWKSSKRTGVRTKALCGVQCRYPLLDCFPMLTRRKIYPRAIWAELVWFLSGSTSNDDLKALGCSYWEPWESREFEAKHGYTPGSFGPVYGFQLRHFGGYYPKDPAQWGIQDHYGRGGFDQMTDLLKRLKEDPTDRRLIFSLWNPQDTHRQRLPPCHLYYQVFVDDDGFLTGFLNQRSADFPVGVPANIAFYSALTCMIARSAGFVARELVHSTVDSHIYEDQIPAVMEYLSLPAVPSPKLNLSAAPTSVFDYRPDHFLLENFYPGPKLNIPVAV